MRENCKFNFNEKGRTTNMCGNNERLQRLIDKSYATPGLAKKTRILESFEDFLFRSK